jgi:hypothetical protein
MAIHAYTMIVNRQAIAARVSSLHYRSEVLEGIPPALCSPATAGHLPLLICERFHHPFGQRWIKSRLFSGISVASLNY